MPLKEHLLRGHSARMLLMGCFSVYVCKDALKYPYGSASLWVFNFLSLCVPSIAFVLVEDIVLMW